MFTMNDLSTILVTISDPSRRAIIARLAKGPARVTEIAAPFDMSLNAVSKHLKVLEAAGLIHREKRGRDHVIEFRGEPLRQVARWMNEYELFWNERLDVLEASFRKKKDRKL